MTSYTSVHLSDPEIGVSFPSVSLNQGIYVPTILSKKQVTQLPSPTNNFSLKFAKIANLPPHQNHTPYLLYTGYCGVFQVKLNISLQNLDPTSTIADIAFVIVTGKNSQAPTKIIETTKTAITVTPNNIVNVSDNALVYLNTCDTVSVYFKATPNVSNTGSKTSLSNLKLDSFNLVVESV